MINPLASIFLFMGIVIPFEAEITYYCPNSCCCGIYADGVTASGKVATEGRTIAAGQQIPFGTEIEIGGTIYTVEDRGSAIRGNKIDIFVSDHQAALENGRHTETAYIKIAP